MSPASLAPNSAIPAGLRRKQAFDAEPKTLYVHRPVKNADAILAWAKEQGFKTTLPANDMHVTIAFSKTPIDWNAAPDGFDSEIVPAAADQKNGERSVEKLGDQGAVVLRFESPDLAARWQQFRRAGAAWDHDGYRPHVTLTYDAGDVDLANVAPYDGPIELGEEVFGEVDPKWRDKSQAQDSKIVIDVDDEDGQLKLLLDYIKKNSEVGHSFGVVVDPEDRELAKKFYIDGDGAFRIREVTIAMDRAMSRATAVMASDSPVEIAMDRDSVREKTREGRLIVKRTHVTKANVCPYRGEEIPGWETLGLDKDRVYYLLRDPEELAKAAPTLNGVQLLIKHKPVSAKDPGKEETVGSFGTDAEFDGEYLDNSMFVNTQEAIDAIESGRQHELSAGYHYKADMTPGNFRGSAYDGVMRDIVFNHVALVEDGRAGPDVVVGDEALKEIEMAKATRFGARTLSITAAAIAPLLAMDQKVTLSADLVGSFKGLTTKNFKDNREKLLSGVRLALDGKLRKGLALDATMKDLAKVVDAFPDDLTSGMDEPAPEDKQAELDKPASIEAPKAIAEPGSTYDAEPLKGFLRDCGMDEDKIAKCMDMMPKPGMAGDSEETPEEKAAREKKEKEDTAAKDAEMANMVSKPAMDAALQAQAADFDKRLKAAAAVQHGIRLAIAEVGPWVGELPVAMAFDSAAAVYRKALEMRGFDGADKLHADALKPILQTLPKAGARASEHQEPVLAMDHDNVKKAYAMAPGLEHISSIL